MLCAYTRPRYQVSVYRIIGPLVLLSISRNYVVSVWGDFFFLLVLGQAVLFYFSPPWTLHMNKLLSVQILRTCLNCCTLHYENAPM